MSSVHRTAAGGLSSSSESNKRGVCVGLDEPSKGSYSHQYERKGTDCEIKGPDRKHLWCIMALVKQPIRNFCHFGAVVLREE